MILNGGLGTDLPRGAAYLIQRAKLYSVACQSSGNVDQTRAARVRSARGEQI